MDVRATASGRFKSFDPPFHSFHLWSFQVSLSNKVVGVIRPHDGKRCRKLVEEFKTQYTISCTNWTLLITCAVEKTAPFQSRPPFPCGPMTSFHGFSISRQPSSPWPTDVLLRCRPMPGVRTDAAGRVTADLGAPGAPGVPIELFRFRRSFQSNSIAKMCPIWSIYIYMSILCFITLSKHKLSVSPTSSALRSKKPSLTSHVSRGLTVQPIIWESIYAMSPPRCRTSKGGWIFTTHTPGRGKVAYAGQWARHRR